MRPRIGLWLALFLLGSNGAAFARESFYVATAADLARTHAAGDLIRSEPIEGAPDGGRAFRVLYRSTGLRGEPIAVSGAIILPADNSPNRPVIAWAHPTTGISDRCAPSLARVLFSSIQGLPDMLSRGYVVAATDYPGLGTPGIHPYLVGESEGRAVLDSVRAARFLPNSNASTTFAVWGHSQGGQAALFTGLLARAYAPDLHLAGVAAAAPATELETLLNDDIDTSGGRNLTAMTLWSWSRVYGAPMEKVITPEALPVVDHLANLCIERIFDIFTRSGPSKALDRSFLKVRSFADTEPWRGLLKENTPGLLSPGIPVFLAQGGKDNLVRPRVTLNYRNQLCRHGSKVWLDWMPGEGHPFAARHSASEAVRWMADRFAGKPAPSNCEMMPPLTPPPAR